VTSPYKSDAHVFTWNLENPQITIHIRRDVIRRIHRDAKLCSLGRQSAESGGLLLGSAQRNSGLEISIEDYKPFDSEHRFGPSYVLSDADKLRLEATLRRQKDDGGPQIIGFYRSHARDGLAFGNEDLELVQSCFPADTYAFLLIKPDAEGNSEATFLFWREENDREESSFHEFPFHVSQEAAEHGPATTAWTMPSSRQIGLGLLSGIGVIAIIAAAVSFLGPAKTESNRLSAPPERQPAPVINAPQPQRTLGLTLALSGNALWLRWQNEAVQQAERAVLQIQDGGARRQIELDRKQLEKGSVLYVPAGGDVIFEMQTVTSDPNVAAPSESIRYISAAQADVSGKVSRAPAKRYYSSKTRAVPAESAPAEPRSDEPRPVPMHVPDVTSGVAESAQVQPPAIENIPVSEMPEPAQPEIIEVPRPGTRVKGQIRNFGGKIRKLWPFGQKQQPPADHQD
jgi:hypothetical protein